MKRIIKFLIFAGITGFFVYIMEFGVKVGSKPIPPIGKLTHPYWGYLYNAAHADKGFDKNLNLTGIEDEVTVVYDDRLVPHIYAKNEKDLFFAQGYVTAQHRLWQMDLQVRVAAGRLSEVLGSLTENVDASNRNKGLAWAAENSVKVFENDPVTKPIVDAYTAGVNAYIEQLSQKEYPVEYKILNYAPEKWSSFKSALLLKYMGDMLTGRATDVQMTNALKAVGQDYVDLLYPDFNVNDSVISPIIPRGTIYPAATQVPDTPATIGLYNTTAPYPTEKYIDGIGSNNWAVSGAKTKSGKPILCNDPHLGLNLPSIWFEMQLNAPGYNTYGVTIPGSPAIIIGFNDSISWGVTNGTQDVLDYYKIKYKDETKKEYQFDGQWMPITTRVEEIKIKGQKTRIDTTRFTHFGPVITNYIKSDTISSDLAIRWSVHDPSNELKTFVLLNRAHNYNQYAEAVKNFESPGQNFVFASVSGDIAIWHSGKYPVRFNQQGKFIMDGTKKIYQWNKFIPKDENPHIKNPERNFVSSANQHPTDGLYPYYYYGRFEHYRNRRINGVLAELDSITIEDMMKLQNDNFNLQAQESLPLMLLALDSASVKPDNKKYYTAIKTWNYVNDAGSMGAVIYEAWFRLFSSAVWDELISTTPMQYEYPQAYTLIKIFKTYPNHAIFDNKHTQKIETARDLLAESFSSVCVELRNWETKHKDEEVTWAGIKGTSVQHMARIAPFGVYNIKIGGNSNIVNAASDRWGPSWRMVVSMENGIKAYGVYPGGQSGNPASKYYLHGIEKWSKGEYFELNFWKTKDIAVSKKMSVQILNKAN
jgi:penicillin amidase